MPSTDTSGGVGSWNPAQTTSKHDESVSAGSTATGLIRWQGDPAQRVRLSVRASTGSGYVEVVQNSERGAQRRHRYHLGGSGGPCSAAFSVVLWGAWDATVVADSGAVFVFDWLVSPPSEIEDLSEYVVHVSRVQVGAPQWYDVGNATETPPADQGGFPPGERHNCQIIQGDVAALLDFRLVDAPGTTVISAFTPAVGTITTFIHPPNMRLQARVNAAVPALSFGRAALTWNRT